MRLARIQVPLKLISALLACSLIGHALPVFGAPATCSEAFLHRAEIDEAKGLRDQWVRQYLFLNLAFPQNAKILSLGLTAHFFTRLGEPRNLGKFTESDFKRVHDAVTRAHAAHGVKRVVSLAEAESTMGPFIQNARGSNSYQAMQFALLPGRFPPEHEAKQNFENFLSSPSHESARHRLRSYSETILSVLRGPEVREMSTRLREQAVAKSYWGVQGVVDEIDALIVARLIQAHPELGRPMREIRDVYTYQNASWEKPKTQAEVLLWAMRGQGF